MQQQQQLQSQAKPSQADYYVALWRLVVCRLANRPKAKEASAVKNLFKLETHFGRQFLFSAPSKAASRASRAMKLQWWPIKLLNRHPPLASCEWPRLLPSPAEGLETKKLQEERATSYLWKIQVVCLCAV